MRKIKDILQTLNKGLISEYSEEQFLPEELEAVMQAIINSIRWSAIRYAEAQVLEGNPFEVETLLTVDHFCTEWMERDEIVCRIEHTSGLTYDQSVYALRYVEFLVDTYINGIDPEIEHLGLIRDAENGRYVIELAGDLKISSGGEYGQATVLHA